MGWNEQLVIYYFIHKCTIILYLDETPYGSLILLGSTATVLRAALKWTSVEMQTQTNWQIPAFPAVVKHALHVLLSFPFFERDKEVHEAAQYA